MNITITPGKLKGKVTPPPSKSQAHRLMIAAALAEGESVISNVAHSDDVDATVSCLEQLGAGFLWEGDTLTVTGIGANSRSHLAKMAYPKLDCGESGSTLRFLIPVVLAVRGGGVFTGHGRLMERPLQPYFDLFDEKGISYELKDNTLTVSGLLTPGEYKLPGHISSQFFTGLMFALPLLEGDSKITLTTPLESGDYVELTRDVLRGAGVIIEGGHIAGGQTYHAMKQTVEADWSQAAFFYAAHGLGHEVSLSGLNPFSHQPDAQIVDMYIRLCSADEDVLLNVSQCPDLFPPLAILAALQEGVPVSIGGAARLRLKESDRITAVVNALNTFGVQVEEYDDGISLVGGKTLRGKVTIDCCGDHRIAMMAAIGATCATRPVVLKGAECVAKSYPNFWDDFEALGGIITRED